MRTLTVVHLGETPYDRGVALQDALVAARAAGATGDWLLYCDHPPVLTLGRGGDGSAIRADGNALAARGIRVFETARGGDVTWHGPGQLVGYPIVDLTALGRDLHRYLRALEGALIEALAGFGVAARVVPGRTGVWAGDEKLASIGIAVRRWVGYHGFALNVSPDLADFDLIHPCGLRGVRMTSLERLLGPAAPSLEVAREGVTAALARALGHDAIRRAGAGEARRAAAPFGTAPDPDAAEAESAHQNDQIAGVAPAHQRRIASAHVD